MALRSSRERGIALLLVVWVFMTLGVLALDFARNMRDDAEAALNYAEETRSYYLALAGMNLRLFDILGDRETPDEPGQDPVDRTWHEGEFGGGRYAVRMSYEGARLPINKLAGEVHRPLLARVITNILKGPNGQVKGVDRREQIAIDTAVDSIIDWIDKNKNVSGQYGAERGYYKGVGLPDRPPNMPINSPGELLMVRGVTPEIYYGRGDWPGLRDVISVFNMERRLSTKTMPPAVVQVLLGKDAEEVKQIMGDSGGSTSADDSSDSEPSDDDGAELATILKAEVTALGDPVFADSITADPPHIVLIEAKADIREERNQAAISTIVEIPDSRGGGDFGEIKYLRWLDRAPWTGGLPSGPGEEAEEAP